MSEFKADSEPLKCLPCDKRKPPVIRWADFMVPIRKNPYDMIKEKAVIDKRLMGVCVECIETLTDFQKDADRHKSVDAENKHLVYRLDE